MQGGIVEASASASASVPAAKRRKVEAAGAMASGRTGKKRTREEAWSKNLLRLEAYRDKNGNCNVPTTWKDEDRFALGLWVYNQKTQHKRYVEDPGLSKLTEWRVAELDRVGAITSWGLLSSAPPAKKRRKVEVAGSVSSESPSVSEGAMVPVPVAQTIFQRSSWLNALSRIESYRDQYGDCNVPKEFKDEAGFGLGDWVCVQKSELKKYEEDPRASCLTAECVSDLGRIGAIFSWLKADKVESSPKV